MLNVGLIKLLVSVVLATTSLSAMAAIDPEVVRIVEQAPKGCKLVGKVSVDSSRLVPGLQQNAGRRAVKKSQQELEDVKEAAAEIGADTVHVPRSDGKAEMVAGKVNAYFCDVPQTEEQKRGVGASEWARRNKRFVAALELGVATPLAAGGGATFGFHLSGNQVIEGNVAVATASAEDDGSISTDSEDYSSYDMRKSGSSAIIGARYKQFVTNSFYWHGGLASRSSKASLYAVEKYGDESTKIASVDYSDLGLTLAIGSQWQWDTFTMGCDWIGIYAPVVKTKSDYESSNEDTVSSSDAKKARSNFRDEMQALNIQGLRFYLGAAF